MNCNLFSQSHSLRFDSPFQQGTTCNPSEHQVLENIELGKYYRILNRLHAFRSPLGNSCMPIHHRWNTCAARSPRNRSLSCEVRSPSHPYQEDKTGNPTRPHTHTCSRDNPCMKSNFLLRLGRDETRSCRTVFSSGWQNVLFGSTRLWNWFNMHFHPKIRSLEVKQVLQWCFGSGQCIFWYIYAIEKRDSIAVRAS